VQEASQSKTPSVPPSYRRLGITSKNAAAEHNNRGTRKLPLANDGKWPGVDTDATMLLMEVTDYNGKGRWSAEAIQARYSEQAARLGVREPLALHPKEFTRGSRRWVYPLMDAVILGIEAGDQACCVLGVEFLEEDAKFSFGANLKYRCARALRRAELSEALATRLRRRIVAMLLVGNVPREFREYARLLRRVGFENFWPRIEAGVSRQNKYVMRYFGYFELIHQGSPAVIRQTNPARPGATRIQRSKA
jgi:hypothetical protein